MNSPIFRWVLALLLFFSAAASATEMQINFARDGDIIKIDGHLMLPYPPKRVFEVLTDYDHMQEYIPDMSSSRVLNREDNKWRVEQKGKSGIGPFKFKFEVVRDVELMPVSELKSTLVSGNFKSMRTSTTLTPEDNNTRLDYSAEMEPDFWVPPLLGSAIMKRQVRRQFEAFIDELAKRSRATGDTKKTIIIQ